MHQLADNINTHTYAHTHTYIHIYIYIYIYIHQNILLYIGTKTNELKVV